MLAIERPPEASEATAPPRCPPEPKGDNEARGWVGIISGLYSAWSARCLRFNCFAPPVRGFQVSSCLAWESP